MTAAYAELRFGGQHVLCVLTFGVTAAYAELGSGEQHVLCALAFGLTAAHAGHVNSLCLHLWHIHMAHMSGQSELTMAACMCPASHEHAGHSVSLCVLTCDVFQLVLLHVVGLAAQVHPPVKPGSACSGTMQAPCPPKVDASNCLQDLKKTLPELGKGLQQLLDYQGDVEELGQVSCWVT